MTPEQAAQAQLDAYNGRDIEAFLRVYDPAVDVRALPDNREVALGRDGMRPIYTDLFARAPELHCELLSRVVKERFVVDHERVTGIGDDPVFAVAIYEVIDGLIRRVWFLK